MSIRKDNSTTKSIKRRMFYWELAEKYPYIPDRDNACVGKVYVKVTGCVDKQRKFALSS